MIASDAIRTALKQKLESGTTIYAVAKATGLNNSVLARFVNGERKQIRSETIDRLCEYLGLEVRPASGTTTPAAGSSSSTSTAPPGPAAVPPFDQVAKEAEKSPTKKPPDNTPAEKATASRSAGKVTTGKASVTQASRMGKQSKLAKQTATRPKDLRQSEAKRRARER